MTWHGWYAVVRSPLPRLMKHASMAIWPFVLDADGNLPKDTLAHEVEHLRQQLVTYALGFAVLLLFGWWHWWTVVLVLGHGLYGAAYGVSWLFKGYKRMWFERHANRARRRS